MLLLVFLFVCSFFFFFFFFLYKDSSKSLLGKGLVKKFARFFFVYGLLSDRVCLGHNARLQLEYVCFTVTINHGDQTIY